MRHKRVGSWGGSSQWCDFVSTVCAYFNEGTVLLCVSEVLALVTMDWFLEVLDDGDRLATDVYFVV